MIWLGRLALTVASQLVRSENAWKVFRIKTARWSVHFYGKPSVLQNRNTVMAGAKRDNTSQGSAWKIRDDLFS